jgi:hypothetical protein
MFLALAALMILAMSALADPGVRADNIVSDQKAGSVLVYNLYASSSTDPSRENSRINITNTNDRDGIFVHLFFVDGRSCAVADSYICLSKSQTTSILASDVDPDVRGYIVAVAVNSYGIPVDFDYLIGDEYVKLASGHAANLGAEAIEALDPSLIIRDAQGRVVFDPNEAANMTFVIAFDGVHYGLVPRVLALDSIASPRDGNDTLLVVNRVGGSLQTGGGNIGSMFGILFDELEAGYSYQIAGGCQLVNSLSDNFPRTTPRLTNIIPAGSTGWTKFWATANVGILGAAINKNTSASATSFNGGHNLHKLTYTADAYRVPVFTAMCS